MRVKYCVWVGILFLSSPAWETPDMGDPNSGFPSCVVDNAHPQNSFEHQIKSGLVLSRDLKTILIRVSWYGYHSVDSFDKPISLSFQEDGTVLLGNWRYKLPLELHGTYQLQNNQIFMRFESPIRVGDGLGYLEYPSDFVGSVSEEGLLAIKVRYPKSPDKVLELMTFADTLYKCK
jgi:hypothetical protein